MPKEKQPAAAPSSEETKAPPTIVISSQVKLERRLASIEEKLDAVLNNKK